MTQELDYFTIEGATGGSQSWLRDYMMKLGGCAAVTACDSSIYFDLSGRTKGLYPFDLHHLTRRDFRGFAKIMKPYLRPRMSGINTLELYMDGYGEFLRNRGETGITMEGLSGNRPLTEAEEAVSHQIDEGIPIPCLILHHRNPALNFYEWHWFILAGYRREKSMEVKAITYGSYRWLDLAELWNTGYEERGGLILYT